MPEPTVLKHVRRICLAFPESVEKETWGHPTFRVRDKIFASFGVGALDDRPVMTMKAPPGEQEILLAADDRFFYPRYVGSKGWIGVYVDDADWDEIAELVEDSYRMTAPKKLIEQLP